MAALLAFSASSMESSTAALACSMAAAQMPVHQHVISYNHIRGDHKQPARNSRLPHMLCGNPGYALIHLPPKSGMRISFVCLHCLRVETKRKFHISSMTAMSPSGRDTCTWDQGVSCC